VVLLINHFLQFQVFFSDFKKIAYLSNPGKQSIYKMEVFNFDNIKNYLIN